MFHDFSWPTLKFQDYSGREYDIRHKISRLPNSKNANQKQEGEFLQS